MGGSAFDLQGGVSGVLPKDQTLLSVLFSYRRFSSQFEGSNAIDDDDPDVLELFMTTLGFQHHFGGGLSANVSLPTGHLRYDQEDGVQRLSGIGDASLGMRYNFAGIWGTGGYHPSLTLHLGLGLPTGDSLDANVGSREDDGPSTDLAPVSLLSLGLGVFSAAADIEYTQFVHRAVALTFRGSIKIPLSAKDTGVTYGTRLGYNVGVLTLPASSFFLGASLDGSYMTQAKEEHSGTLSKSGGHWLAAQGQTGFFLSDTMTLSLLGRLPFFTKVNDRQISETFSVIGSFAWRFGGDDHDHGLNHRHDDEDMPEGRHDHEDHEGDDHEGHDHEDHEGDDHEGHEGHDHEDHEGDDHEDQEGDDHEGHDHEGHSHPHDSDATLPNKMSKPADISDAATGGESFVLADVLVAGKVTVIDFWADWCAPCHQIDADLRDLAERFPKLAVRRVEVPHFSDPVGREHLAGVRGLPIVWIYDGEGKRLERLVAVTPERVKKRLIQHLTHPTPSDH